MNIAILGAGNVGGALARNWSHSHSITFGVPSPASDKTRARLAELGGKVRAATVAEAVRGAEVIVLATPWNATREALAAAGNLSGKTVIDCTNPLKADLSGLEVGHTSSGAELVAGWARGASVFKAFNQTGAETMGDPSRYPHKLVMFVCGDDAARKPLVLKLVEECGLEAVDAGPLTAARLLEPLAMLWIHLAFRCGQGREFAFALAHQAPAR